MPTVITVDEFLKLLQRSGLLSSAQFDAAIEGLNLGELARPDDAADALVAAGTLTRYQANRLLEGRRRGLFIDDYKILEILGSGGMGYLYTAEELEGGWTVALKVLADRFRYDKGRLTRFQLEAEAGLKLTHPNILRTKAIRRTEDIYGVIYYMVLELVRGANLRELLEIRRRTLHWRQACDVICQAATGLGYAHEMGLVHRDIKPENVLIRNDGIAKILDFGLAMIGGSETEFSLSTILGQNCLGTADYIAPEQSIDSLNVDQRADIYSLGGTFHFLLTGQVPFPVESVSAKLKAHRQQRAPRVCDLNPRIPEKIGKIVQKMMAKRPENRFQSTSELLKILSPIAYRKPIDFDFDSVIAQRARIAEQRLASESVLRGDSRTSVVSRLEIGTPRDAKKTTRETVVPRETSIDRKKQSPER